MFQPAGEEGLPNGSCFFPNTPVYCFSATRSISLSIDFCGGGRESNEQLDAKGTANCPWQRLRPFLTETSHIKEKWISVHRRTPTSNTFTLPLFGRDPSNRYTLLSYRASPISDCLVAYYSLDDYPFVSFSEMEDQKNIDSNGCIHKLSSIVEALLEFTSLEEGNKETVKAAIEQTQAVEKVDLNRDGFGPLNFHVDQWLLYEIRAIMARERMCVKTFNLDTTKPYNGFPKMGTEDLWWHRNDFLLTMSILVVKWSKHSSTAAMGRSTYRTSSQTSNSTTEAELYQLSLSQHPTNTLVSADSQRGRIAMMR
ncbi:hypothetical protein PROFUN_04688 [Planoprotostelium fungivorum]|uniref:Uncharacterized protein n=1 Tax=Planoprotostelium fungivorum TaxID=1890364 RepID=A0A2P6NFW8_9EUKA|nr:hypothetical protein PROFUN_04688 [Planoprotostelium fungivorum]